MRKVSHNFIYQITPTVFYRKFDIAKSKLSAVLSDYNLFTILQYIYIYISGTICIYMLCRQLISSRPIYAYGVLNRSISSYKLFRKYYSTIV